MATRTAVALPCSPAFSRAVERMRAQLGRCGIHAVLRQLNAAAGFRFTAVHVFERGLVRSVAAIDASAPGAGVAWLADTVDSCCRFVREDGAAVVFDDTLTVARLEQHPLRAVVRAYAGVPLRNEDGAVIGVLCHYDIVPRTAAAADLEMLAACARAILR